MGITDGRPRRLSHETLKHSHLKIFVLEGLYCKMPIKRIIDFLSLDMVVLLKEVLEGVEDGQNVINKSCRAYPL